MRSALTALFTSKWLPEVVCVALIVTGIALLSIPGAVIAAGVLGLIMLTAADLAADEPTPLPDPEAPPLPGGDI